MKAVKWKRRAVSVVIIIVFIYVMQGMRKLDVTGKTVSHNLTIRNDIRDRDRMLLGYNIDAKLCSLTCSLGNAHKDSIFSQANRNGVNFYKCNNTYNLKPNNKGEHSTVVIDAGHGGIDSGAIGINRSLEKNNTLSTSLKLGKLLSSKGIKVVYTRKSDKVSFPVSARANLEARTQVANNLNADLFISIHNNSSLYKSVSGLETYYCNGSAKAKALATLIHKELVNNVKLKNRGVRASDYYVLKNTVNTAVLIELGYISNRDEEAKLKNSKFQDKCAAAMAEGVLKYLSE